MNSKFSVPFETAKQLKENGYPQEFADWYYHESADELAFVHNRYVPERVVTGKPTKLGVWYTAAPTYHEVVDWLDMKGIYITCYAPLLKPVGRYAISVFNSNTNDWGMCRGIYPTREEALNAAILKALEMI